VHVATHRVDNGLGLNRLFPCGREDECLCLSHGDVDGLQQGDGKGGRSIGSGWGLHNHISTLDYGKDGMLLNRRGLLTVCMDDVLGSEVHERSVACTPCA